MRERTQLGGWSGGGATSCDHRDRERSVRKVELVSGRGGGGSGGSSAVVGYNASRCGDMASMMDSREFDDEKSRTSFSRISQGCSGD